MTKTERQIREKWLDSAMETSLRLIKPIPGTRKGPMDPEDGLVGGIGIRNRGGGARDLPKAQEASR